MFRNYLFTALMLLPFALSAQDSRYHLVLSNANEDIYLDKQSISRSGEIVQAWARHQMKMQYPTYYAKMLHKVDCEKEELRVVKGILLDASNDTILHSMEINSSEQVVYSEIADKMRDFLCSASPP